MYFYSLRYLRTLLARVEGERVTLYSCFVLLPRAAVMKLATRSIKVKETLVQPFCRESFEACDVTTPAMHGRLGPGFDNKRGFSCARAHTPPLRAAAACVHTPRSLGE